MKIAHIVCKFPPYKGGMGNSALHFAELSAENGYDVTVFTPCYGDIDKDSSIEIEKFRNFKIDRLRPLFKIGNAAVIPQLFLKLRSFDIIFLHYPFYGVAEFILLYKLFFGKRTKLIIHFHMEPTARGIRGLVFNFNRWILRPLLFRAADIITCASLDYVEHSDLSGYYRKNKNKFREIFFGVDLNIFKPRQVEQKKIKTILFVGGLDKAHYFKGVDVLIKAASKFKFNNYKLQIVGGGDLRPQYEKLAIKLGIGDKVDFAGRIKDKDLPFYYNNCDVFVLPSINKGEAFGMVLLEAMASGKPVITSNLPGVRNVFQNGMQGLLIKAGDAEDLRQKIEIVLGDDNLSQKMGREGRILAEKKYNWESAGRKLNEIYKK